MTLHFGNVAPDDVLYIPFETFDSSGASVSLTGLATTDIEIFKNGSVTERASDSGYSLLDSDGIDFDGRTGLHAFSIDLSDNSDAGFYAVGGQYWVLVDAVTVDAQTVRFLAATFRISPEPAAGNTVVYGVCGSGGSTTLVRASSVTPDSTVDEQFKNRRLIFRHDTATAALRGQATSITDYTHTNRDFTVTDLTNAPASGDRFVVV